MAKIVPAICPTCGANLKLDPQVEGVTCSYCGTTSVVQRSKSAKAPPPQPGQYQQPVIYVPTATRHVWVMVLIPLLIVFGSVGFLVLKGRGAAGGILSGKLQFNGNLQPMLYDVNSDDVLDVIGWIRILKGSKVTNTIAAFNGRNGEKLWQLADLPNHSPMHEARAAVVEDWLVVVDPRGKVHAFDAERGKVAWTKPLGERAKRICAGKDFVAIETIDKKMHAFSLARGGARSAPSADKCRVPWTDQPGQTPNYELLKSFPFGNDVPPAIKGMNIGFSLRKTTGGPTFVIGERSEGTRVPMVAAQDGKKTSWKQRVPGVDPLTVQEGAPGPAALSGSKLFIAYRLKDRAAGWRLACFKTSDGERPWDVAVPKSGTGDLRSVVASKRYVFVSHWTYLSVFSRKTGKLKYQLGRWM